ncbi:hypothetical protein P5673_012970 [Acropora cervicornis]|uniref:Uncharacterized protein n=1 Tax=Acropora cervicornis TaxID=6130 RepID=A0AAD9QMG3_ACRCE|nr:hypothetical protein P5673_012970 [Acropora cervicornis]
MNVPVTKNPIDKLTRSFYTFVQDAPSLGSCYKDQDIQGVRKKKKKKCSDQGKADVSGRLQMSVEEGEERRGASIQDRTVSLGSSHLDHDIQGGMKRKRKKCSDRRKAGSSDKDQGIQRGIGKKRKKCRDLEKEDIKK